MSFPPPESEAGAPGSGPRVAVIGAGAVGVCTALALAQSGAAVTLVEGQGRGTREPARRRAASANAAGMLGAYSEALYEGANTHRLFAKLCAAGHAAWESLLLAHPVLEDGVRDTGALLLAHADADMARVLRVRDRARQAGAHYEWTDGLPDDLDAHIYSLRVTGALRLPEERLVDPGLMLDLLTDLFLQAGGSILAEREASHLAVRGGRARGVAFADGSGLVADAVVLAPGAMAPPGLVEVSPALKRITPAKGILGIVRPADDLDIQETIRTQSVYLAPTRSGELIFGSTMEMGRTDVEPDEAALQTLFQHMRRALPGARFESPPRFHAAGVRPMSPDWAPMIGPSGPEGCFVACGHSRNGWLLGPLTGRILAAQVLGKPLEDLWTAFTPDRFEKKAA
jgi:glycine oxidase